MTAQSPSRWVAPMASASPWPQPIDLPETDEKLGRSRALCSSPEAWASTSHGDAGCCWPASRVISTFHPGWRMCGTRRGMVSAGHRAPRARWQQDHVCAARPSWPARRSSTPARHPPSIPESATVLRLTCVRSEPGTLLANKVNTK